MAETKAPGELEQLRERCETLATQNSKLGQSNYALSMRVKQLQFENGQLSSELWSAAKKHAEEILKLSTENAPVKLARTSKRAPK